MKSKKTLILVALEAELGAENVAILSEQCDVRMTGMGKLLSFEATLTALQEGDYDTIINIGTCGSFRHPFATVLRPKCVAQGDVYIDPESVFYSEPEIVETGDEGCSIASSDNFIGSDTSESLRRLIEPYDCMDMESYAIVRAIRFYTSQRGVAMPKIYMVKVVSDGCDGTVDDWQTRIERLRPTLLAAAQELLKEINNPER
ncbi:MAG: hypothetical protein IIW87_00180 [Alistipes sp.]|nr:hypothetical protein [Alistipes sp.]